MTQQPPAREQAAKGRRQQSDGTEFLTARTLAERWGVKPATIWRWAAKGVIPKPVKLGPQITKWPLAAIERHELEGYERQQAEA